MVLGLKEGRNSGLKLGREQDVGAFAEIGVKAAIVDFGGGTFARNVGGACWRPPLLASVFCVMVKVGHFQQAGRRNLGPKLEEREGVKKPSLERRQNVGQRNTTEILKAHLNLVI